MKAHILIVTWERDLPYLKWCLRSILRFENGFMGVTVLYPKAQAARFLAKGELPDQGFLKYIGFDEFPGKGMLDAMAQKMMADQWCPKAEYIAHVDADCLFREPFRPEDFFVGGKPVLLYAPYETLHDGAQQWQAVVEQMLGVRPELETMRRHPMVNPSFIYATHRERLERRWGLPMRHYFLTGRNEFPQQICEYNSLGWHAWENYRECYHWIDVSKKGARPKDKLIQFWSHGPIDQPQEIWLDGEKVVVVPELLAKEIIPD